MVDQKRGPIDGHVHLWDLNRRRLPWLPVDSPLRRSFTVDELRRAACDPGWRFVAVQADADPAEVIDLLDLAAVEPAIAGVVGWFDLLDRRVAWAIADARRHADRVGARLSGVRCPPVDQRDPAALSDPAFVAGVRTAVGAGLAVDLLIRPPALAAAARLAAAVPEGTFVINHLGLPDHDVDLWRRGIVALAAQPSVVIKLSGPARPRLAAEVLERFGAQRVIFGSDWPVSSTDHLALLLQADDLVPDDARPDVFSETARRVYRLDPAEDVPLRSDQNCVQSDQNREDLHAQAQPT